MSLDLQEWLALAAVVVVIGAALWQRRTHKQSRAFSGCSVASFRPPPGGNPLLPGGKTDPYRPRLTRPED